MDEHDVEHAEQADASIETVVTVDEVGNPNRVCAVCWQAGGEVEARQHCGMHEPFVRARCDLSSERAMNDLQNALLLIYRTRYRTPEASHE